MRVTVTGGTGFLGGFLVRDLIAKGVEVRLLARPSARADALAAGGVQVMRGDLGDAESIARAVSGADVVYHLAAKVGAAKMSDYFAVNVGGTERVLNACAKLHVGQFVYASSLAVYGPVREGVGIDEGTPFDDKPELRDPYAQSKIAADRLVSKFAQRTGLPTVILREGIIYGPRRPLPIGMFAFRMGNTNIVFGNPQNRFPLNYVENLIDAMQAATVSTSGGLRQFNVLDDDDLTLSGYHAVKSSIDGTSTHYSSTWPLRVASPIMEALRPIIPMGDLRLSKHQLDRSLQNRCYDTHLIRQAAGWKPRVALDEAIRRTLASATALP